jgi:hypothetical protein
MVISIPFVFAETIEEIEVFNPDAGWYYNGFDSGDSCISIWSDKPYYNLLEETKQTPEYVCGIDEFDVTTCNWVSRTDVIGHYFNTRIRIVNNCSIAKNDSINLYSNKTNIELKTQKIESVKNRIIEKGIVSSVKENLIEKNKISLTTSDSKIIEKNIEFKETSFKPITKLDGLVIPAYSEVIINKRITASGSGEFGIGFACYGGEPQEILTYCDERIDDDELFGLFGIVENEEQGYTNQKYAHEITNLIIYDEPLDITEFVGWNKLMKFNKKYPNYKEIIPKKSTTSIVFNKNELLNQIKSAALFSGKINEVKINIKTKEKIVEILSESPETGNYNSSISGEIKGDELEVSFNHRFLLDGILNIKSSEILFELSGDSGPGVLKPVGDDTYLYVVMPIKTN